MSRIALVTGANKGIGFALVELLAKDHSDWIVYLGARNKERGEASVNELKAKGLDNVRFGHIDLDDIATLEAFRDHLKKEHGGLDVLVNNAGIFVHPSIASLPDQAEITTKTNFYGTLNVSKTFFPILRSHARVVNVSSQANMIAYQSCSDEMKARMNVKDMKSADLYAIMDDFVGSAKTGDSAEKGFSAHPFPYAVSKIGINLMTGLQQKYFSSGRDTRTDIVVNSCCPGFVKTDATGGRGVKTPEEGCDSLVYLATLPENVESPKGEFVADRKIIQLEGPVTLGEQEQAAIKQMYE